MNKLPLENCELLTLADFLELVKLQYFLQNYYQKMRFLTVSSEKKEF